MTIIFIVSWHVDCCVLLTEHSAANKEAKAKTLKKADVNWDYLQSQQKSVFQPAT